MTLSLIGNLLCEVRSLFFGLFGVRAVSVWWIARFLVIESVGKDRIHISWEYGI